MWVNTGLLLDPAMPAGGYSHSGYGRELGARRSRSTSTSSRSGSRPPDSTIRLAAEVEVAGKQRQLRILGSSDRGFLVVGLELVTGGDGDEEFWFPELRAALARCEQAGVDPVEWRRLGSAADAEVG